CSKWCKLNFILYPFFVRPSLLFYIAHESNLSSDRFFDQRAICCQQCQTFSPQDESQNLPASCLYPLFADRDSCSGQCRNLCRRRTIPKRILSEDPGRNTSGRYRSGSHLGGRACVKSRGGRSRSARC